MLKGFKDFIMRGDLVSVAVAFIMALAFAEVVNATVALILDLIGKAGGQPDFTGWRPGGVGLGAWITAVIAFIIFAAAVYFLIVAPYERLKAAMARGEGEPIIPTEDIVLLQEIRDLLRAQNTATGAPLTPPPPAPGAPKA